MGSGSMVGRGIGRGLRLALAVAISLHLSAAVLAGAFNFQEPADWRVGDAGSTYNNWEAAINDSTPPARRFELSNMAPTSSTVSPAISGISNMSVQSPGFVAGSGGYYSFNGPYFITANIYNHGGPTGSASYADGYGTRLFVQTASTTNPDSDTSVFSESIEVTQLDGTPLAGGANADLIGATELFRQEVITPLGPADHHEMLYEFYLPDYSGDFRVRFQAAMHASFQQLRIDTLLVEEEEAIPGDFDGDGDVDSDDLADWQAGYGTSMNGGDFLLWQRNYTGPGGAAAVSSVPEPTSLLVVIFGIISGLNFRSMRVSE